MIDNRLKLDWPYYPQEKQAESWENMHPFSETTVNGYGAAKFGGKSYNIRALCNMHLMARPLHACIFAREYDQLKDLHIEPIKAEMSEYIKAGKIVWNSNDKQFRFTETGSVLKFIQINRPKDILKHNGKGFDIVCVDEAQMFTTFELKFFPSLCRPSAIAMAAREKARNHIKAADNEEDRKFYKEKLRSFYYKPKALYCFNWGDAGHNYLTTRFWEGCSHRKSKDRDLTVFETEEVKDPETGEKVTKYIEDPNDFSFIFADWRDNQKGYRDNPEYIRTLKRLPEPYRTAWMDGDPYAFAGLKYQISPPVHEVDLDELFEPHGGYVPEHWRLLGALDPGTASPCAFSLYAVSPEGKRYQLTDYYEGGRSFEEHAEQIFYNIKNCRWIDSHNVRLPEYVIAGKDAFHRKSRYSIKAHDITFADIFWEKYGIMLVECITDRVQGAMAVANALSYRIDEETGDTTREPSFYFGCYHTEGRDGELQRVSVCKNTMDELKSLVSSETNPEDIKQAPEIPDHAFDKTKYFLLGAAVPPVETSDVTKLHQHSDYGRIPKSQVYEEKTDDNRTLNDTFQGSTLDQTI